jgi:hypothetical protein
MTTESIPTLHKIDVSIAHDGETIALRFYDSNLQSLSVAFTADSFAGFLSNLIGIGTNAAETAAAPDTEGRLLNTTAVPVTQIGLGDGRDPTEAIVTLRAGAFQMAFGVPWSMLSDLRNQIDQKLVGATRSEPSKH